MERFGIFSRNIVLHNQDLPMCGVILVNDEFIEEVIFNLPKEATYDSVASRFMGTHILDYSDLYVCPGIIDLNVKCNEGWDGRTFASMAAISGGVTFFLEEECIYYLPKQARTSSVDDSLYCDIGQVQRVTDGSLRRIDPEAMAYKGYLMSPSETVDCITNLSRVLSAMEEREAPFILNILSPDMRNLNDASPYHSMSLQDRIDETQSLCSLEFAGGVAYELGQESASSSSDEEEIIEETKTPLMGPAKMRQKLASHSAARTIKYIRKKTVACISDNPNLVIVETALPAKTKQADIFKSLDRRIRHTQEAVSSISKVELSEFSHSGVTSFGHGQVEKPVVESSEPEGETDLLQLERVPEESPSESSVEASASFGKTGTMPIIDMSSLINEPQTSVSGSTTPVSPMKLRFRDRMKTLHTTLSIDCKKESIGPPVRVNTYDQYLVNCPEYWELEGINVFSQAISGSTLKSHVHICGISSARGINKVRHLKRKVKSGMLTCELASPYLYFVDSDIAPGDTYYKAMPQIRSDKNRELLWDCLKYNAVDCLVSQHEPIDPAYKFRESGKFARAVPGINTLGFTLQAVWTILKKPLLQGDRSYEHYIVRLFKWLSENPAKFLKIDHIRGSIAPKRLADLVIWDPAKLHKATHTFSKHTVTNPFVGGEFCGHVEQVYLRGKLVYNHGEVVAHGRMVRRSEIPPL